MVFVEQEVIICKKHPDHKQHPGVCSCCLRERLIKLSTSNSTTRNIAISSSSCNYSPLSSSTYSSTCYSPSGGGGRGHRRIISDVVGPFSFIGTGTTGGGLKKSRSIAFVAREGSVLNEQKKKQGFWSKLIKSSAGKIRSKRVLVH